MTGLEQILIGTLEICGTIVVLYLTAVVMFYVTLAFRFGWNNRHETD